jgi:indole-3-glycerol phosphate synthase
MGDILITIEAYKRAEIAAAKRACPRAALEQAAKAAGVPRGFLTAIEGRLAKKQHALRLLWRAPTRAAALVASPS